MCECVGERACVCSMRERVREIKSWSGRPGVRVRMKAMVTVKRKEEANE